MRVGPESVSTSPANSPSNEDPVTAFDAAANAFEITGELSAMSRRAGLNQLCDALERARDAAAEEMVALRRGDKHP